MDRELFESLNDEPWEEIIPELTKYAYYNIRFRKFVQGEPDDYVQQAIQALYSGNRRWNQEAYPTITDFLKSVIDSMISNWSRSRGAKDQRSTSSIEDVPEIASQEGISIEQYEELEHELFRIVADNPEDTELYCVLDGILDGKKRREIAEEWDLTPDDVTNIKKRLLRRIESDFNRRLLDDFL